jgi:hypothetical protein
MESTSLLRLDQNIWFFLVKSNSSSIELTCEFFFVLFTLLGVKHHDNEICRLTDRNDLPTATLTRSCTLDNSW